MGLIRLRWGSLIFLAAIASLLVSCSSSNSNAPNPTPTITSIFPDSITAGSAMFNIDITGQGFLNKPASVALWNGSPRTTIFNAATGHLTITILAADVSNPSVGLVSVMNSGPGGGTSSGVSFTINPLQNGAPMNISLDPSSANARTKGPFKLTVNGTNFVAGSIIRWNGTFRQPTSVTATALTTDLTTTDLALAGFASVSVDNPLPGGIVASSVSVDFLINSAKGANTSAPQVMSVNASGGPADGASAAPAISADGRFVAFYSQARNLVREGASGNIFLRDTCLSMADCTPHTVAVDLAPDGSAPNARASEIVAMSADGRFVAFASFATNLVPGSPQTVNAGGAANVGDGKLSVFVRDLCVGANVPAGCTPHTELLASNVNGPRDYRFSPSLSADGRYAAFVSEAPSLASSKPLDQTRVYVRDTCAGPTATVACVPKTIPVMAANTNLADDGQATQPKISSTGRYVALQIRTPSGTKIGGRTSSQVYLWDSCLGADAPAACVPSTLRISVAPDETTLEGLNAVAAISAEARFVVFESQGLGEGGGEFAAPRNIFLRDTCLGPTVSDGCIPSTTLIHSEKTTTVGAFANFSPSISSSGRFISFVVGGAGTGLDEIGAGSVLIHDTCFGASTACTPATNPIAAPGIGGNPKPLIVDRITPVPLTVDGRYAAYYSRAAIDSSAPVSGQGDVFLTATPFK
jgi:hypothetical protein